MVKSDLENSDAIVDEGSEEERSFGAGRGDLSHEDEGGVASGEAGLHQLLS